MISADRDALICDLAETYGIWDYKALPLPLLATLAVGLRDNSRIKMRMAGARQPTDTILLGAAVDHLAFLRWERSRDAQSGRNRPASVLSILLDEPERKTTAFSSAEEFEAARERILQS